VGTFLGEVVVWGMIKGRGSKRKTSLKVGGDTGDLARVFLRKELNFEGGRRPGKNRKVGREKVTEN